MGHDLPLAYATLTALNCPEQPPPLPLKPALKGFKHKSFFLKIQEELNMSRWKQL